MGWKCKDCGTVLTDENINKPRSHISLCKDCWELRGKFVAAMDAGQVSQQQLESVQRTTVRSKRMKAVLNGK